MAQAWRDWGGVVYVTAAGLPLVLLALWALARRRIRAGTPGGIAWRRSVGEVGMVAGTLPWLWMLLSPQPGPGGVSLLPLRDLALQVAGDPGTAVAQIVGNLLVFAAAGFFARVRFGARARIGRLAGWAAAAAVLAETLQYVLGLGRVSSIDDVLLNALGAALAGVVARTVVD